MGLIDRLARLENRGRDEFTIIYMAADGTAVVTIQRNGREVERREVDADEARALSVGAIKITRSYAHRPDAAQ